MMRLLFLVSLSIVILATDCYGSSDQRRHTKGNQEKSGALFIGDLEITFTDEDVFVPTPPFLMAIFEIMGEISSGAMSQVQLALDRFVLAELNKWYAPFHLIHDVNTTVFTQEYIEHDGRDLGGEELSPREQIEMEMAQGAADTPVDEYKSLRGRRKLNIPGRVMEMQLKILFDRQPAPSRNDVDNALKQIMQDLSLYVSNITATNDPELANVFLAIRREIPVPTESPTLEPTLQPSASPSETPTASPTQLPTESPTESPTSSPSKAPTNLPSASPSETPTASPTQLPTESPTESPTSSPSKAPTNLPTISPTNSPTISPTVPPSGSPTLSPTANPTRSPTVVTGSGNTKPGGGETPSPSVVPGSGNMPGGNSRPPNNGGDTPSPTSASGAGNTTPGGDTPLPTSASGSGNTTPGGDTPSPTSASGSGNTTPGGDTPSPTPASGSGNTTPGDMPSPTVVMGSGNTQPTGGSTSPPTDISGSGSTMPTNIPGLPSSPTSASPSDMPAELPAVIPTDLPTAPPSISDEILTTGASPWDPKETSDMSNNMISKATSSDYDDKETNNTALIASLVCVGAAMVMILGLLAYRRRHRDDDSQRGDLLVVESDLDSIDPSMVTPSTNKDSVFGGLESGSLESPHLAKTKSLSSATTIRANNVLKMTPKSNGGSLFAFSEEDSDEGEDEDSQLNASQVGDDSRYTPRNLDTQEHIVDTGDPSMEASNRPVSPTLSEPSYSNLMKADDDSDWKPSGIATAVAAVMGATVGAAFIGSRRRQSDADSKADPKAGSKTSNKADPDGAFPSMTESELARSRQHAGYQGEGDGTMVYQTAAAAVNPLDLSQRSEGSSVSEQNTSFCGSLTEFPDNYQKKICYHGESPMSGIAQDPDTPKSAVSSLSGSVASKDTAASSQISRQLINDLVWLEKKIADVKTTGDVATAIRPDENEVVQSELTTDSLSSAAKGAKTSTSVEIDCREIIAPPGRLQVVIHSTRDGPAVHDVRKGSPLLEQLLPGDLIIAIDNDDTRALGADQVMKMMAERNDSQRRITILRYTGK